MKRWFLFSLLIFTFPGVASAVELRTTIWPPYQIMLQGELSGESTKTLACIFGDINESFNVQVMPWRRAIQDIKMSAADGLFTSGPTPELDDVATMSAPFALEKWYWYHTRDLDLTDPLVFNSLRVGAVRSSNQAAWLESRGIPIAEQVNEGLQLVRLARAGRIDLFLADDRHFGELLIEEDKSTAHQDTSFNRTFVRYMPLGVYFANEFLEEHPEFLSRFNKEIADCSGNVVALSQEEREHIISVVEKRVRRPLDSDRLSNELKAYNPMQVSMSDEVVLALDRQWRSELLSAEQPLISEVLSRTISGYLRSVQQNSDHLITEIMLVGARGLNVAQSSETTDYFQADEEEWKHTFAAKTRNYYVGGIRYDESSRKFQVKVSWAVFGRNAEPAGILIFGIDVEEALKNVY